MAGETGEISSVGVKLTLEAGDFLTGLGQAESKMNALQEQAKTAGSAASQLTAGRGSSSSGSLAAQDQTTVSVGLTVSKAAIKELRTQITSDLGSIPVTIDPILSKEGLASIKSMLGSVVADMYGSSQQTSEERVSRSVRKGPQRREFGGPVSAGHPYLVGEKRAEVFRPSTSGVIFPDADQYRRREMESVRREQQKQVDHQRNIATYMQRMAGGPVEPQGPLQRRHEREIGRIRGGGVRGHGGKYGSARPGSSRTAFAEPGWAHHVTDELNPIRSSSIPGVRPLSRGFYGEPSSSWWGGGIQPRYGHAAVRTRPTRDFLNEGTYFDSAGSPSPVWRTSSVVPRPRLQYWGDDNDWHSFRRGRARMAGGPVEPQGPLQRRLAGLPPLERPRPQPVDTRPVEPEWMRRARERTLPPKQYRMAGGPTRPSRSLEARALRMFGETDEISEAGYISPSGRYLDFSGRYQASGYRRQGNRFVPEGRWGGRDYLSGQRNVDHREVAPLFPGRTRRYDAEAMEWMQGRGYARLMPLGGNELNIDIQKPLTEAQIRRLSEEAPYLSHARVEVYRPGGSLPGFLRETEWPVDPMGGRRLPRFMREANEFLAKPKRRMAGGPVRPERPDYSRREGETYEAWGARRDSEYASYSERLKAYFDELMRQATGQSSTHGWGFTEEDPAAYWERRRQQEQSAPPRPGPARGDPRSQIDKLKAMAGQETQSPNEAAIARRMLREKGVPGYIRGGRAMAGRVDVSAIEPNFRSFFASATPEQFSEGKDWYAKWGAELRSHAGRLGIAPEILTSVAAQLSPRNSWPGNFNDAIKYAEAWQQGLPMPKASTFGANQKKAWQLLQDEMSGIVGPKINPFGGALLGDVNARPQDIWMKRVAVNDLLLPDSKGTPSPRQRKEMDRVVDALAGEHELEPRQVQAIIWTAARDQGIALRGSTKHSRMRAEGGSVLESFKKMAPYIAHGKRPGVSWGDTIKSQAPFVIQRLLAERLGHAQGGLEIDLANIRPNLQGHVEDTILGMLDEFPIMGTTLSRVEVADIGRWAKYLPKTKTIQLARTDFGADPFNHWTSKLDRSGIVHSDMLDQFREGTGNAGAIVRHEGMHALSEAMQKFGQARGISNVSGGNFYELLRSLGMGGDVGDISPYSLSQRTFNTRLLGLTPDEIPAAATALGEEPWAELATALRTPGASLAGLPGRYRAPAERLLRMAAHRKLGGRARGDWGLTPGGYVGPMNDFGAGGFHIGGRADSRRPALHRMNRDFVGSPMGPKALDESVRWMLTNAYDDPMVEQLWGTMLDPRRSALTPFPKKEIKPHALGGSSDLDGLYIVGEVGPELFVPDRLKHLVPEQVMAQIPRAKDGIQVIGQKPYSLFAPEENGTIIPNRLMHMVPHAKEGVRTDPQFDDIESDIGYETRAALQELGKIMAANAIPLGGPFTPENIGALPSTIGRDFISKLKAAQGRDSTSLSPKDLEYLSQVIGMAPQGQAPQVPFGQTVAARFTPPSPYGPATPSQFGYHPQWPSGSASAMPDEPPPGWFVAGSPEEQAHLASTIEEVAQRAVEQEQAAAPAEPSPVEIAAQAVEKAAAEPRRGRGRPRVVTTTTSGDAATDAIAIALRDSYLADAENRDGRGQLGRIQEAMDAGVGPFQPMGAAEHRRMQAQEEHILQVARHAQSGQRIKRGTMAYQYAGALGVDPENPSLPTDVIARLQANPEALRAVIGAAPGNAETEAGGTPPPVEPPVMEAGPAPEEPQGPTNEDLAAQNAALVAEREAQGLAGAGMRGDHRRPASGDAFIAGPPPDEESGGGGGEGGSDGIKVFVTNWPESLTSGGGGGRGGRRPPADALVADTASETSPEPVSELPPPVDDMVAEGSEEETAKKPRERPLRPGDIGFAAPKNYDVWSYPPTGDSPDIGLAPMPEDRYQAMGGGQMQAGPTVVGGAYHTYDPRHWSDEEGALAEAKRRKESEKDVSKRMGADVRSQEVQRVQDEKAEEERVYSFVDELYANQGRVRGSRPTESPEQIRARREAEKARLEADLAAKLAAKKAPGAGPTPPGSGPTPPGSGPTSPGGRWIPFPGHPNWEVREDHAADLSGMKPKDILGSYYKGSIRRLGTAIDEPAPLSFEGRAAVNFGRVQAAHAAKLRNEYEVDPTLAESRGGEPGTRAHAAEQYRQSQVRLQKINAETARRVQDFQAADLTLKRSRQNDSTPENIASFEKRRAESHTRLMDIIQKRKAAREQLRSLEGTVEPASMSFEAREAQGVGREWAIHDARMRNEYEMDPVLSRVRLGRVGYQSMMTERTPRGSAAVQGALGLGGGITFKERQELARQAQMKYSRTTTEFERRRSEFEAADTTLEEAKTNKSTPAEVAEFQRQRDVKRAELADITTKQTSARRFMLETEEAAAPSKVDVARNFASIIAATSAYGKAMMVASEIIEKAAIPAVKALGDSLLGWRPTATLITSAMAQQVTAANGNFQAVMAQTGATAGLSKELMKLVSGTVEGSVTAKAGQAALATTGGLVRTAANMGTGSAAPEGLFGGYGGVLGSAFFATEMGGGKGTFETVGDTFDELGKQVDDARNKAAVARGPHESQPWGWIPQNPLSSWIDSMTGVSMDPDQAKSDLATRTEILKGYQGDLNAAFEREAEFSKRPEGAFQVQEDATKEQKDAFLGAAIQTNDPAAFDAAKKMIQNGFVLTDAFGNVTASANELEAALSALAKGKTIADVGTWASGFQRQMEGQMQASAIQAERQRTLSIPWGVAQQTISNPLIQPGIGFFPTSGQGTIGSGQIARAGMTGSAAGLAGQWLGQATQSQGQIRSIAAQGIVRQQREIQQNSPGMEGIFKSMQFGLLTAKAMSASRAIADVASSMARAQQEASQLSWDNQIRLAKRSYGDALAMQGKIASADGKIHATRLGQLQREQFLNQRAGQRLGLQLQQREITTQLALAQFQAPGETGEERYFRQKEAITKAGIGQQQLDISWKSFEIDGEIWAENVNRAAKDAKKSYEIMEASRNAEGLTIAGQQMVAEKNKLLAVTLGEMDALVGESNTNFNAALSAATGGVQQFTGTIKDAIVEIYRSVGMKASYEKGDLKVTPGTGMPATAKYGPATTLPLPPDERPSTTRPTTATPAVNYNRYVTPKTPLGRLEREYDQDMNGNNIIGAASGALFNTTRPTNLTVGEAKGETVAVLRNPRAASMSEFGGGAANVTVNINGASVRSDDDISSLARRVAVEVERSLSRKGQMFGLRGPAV